MITVAGRFEQYQQSHLLLTLPVSTEAGYTVTVQEPAPSLPARRKETSHAASLLVTPDSVDFGTLPFWDDVAFRYVDPQARTVALIGDFTQWRQHPVSLVREGDTFTTSLALPDGWYRYRFVVNEREVLDPGNPYRLSLTPYGVASLRQVQRWRRPVQLTNPTQRTMTVTVAASHAWLRAMPTQLTLPAHATGEVILAPQRNAMVQGVNEAHITLRPSSARRSAVTVVVRVHLDSPALLVQPQYYTLDLGKCVRGTVTTLELPLHVSGAGDLDVLLYNHGDATLHRVPIRRAPSQPDGIERYSMPFDLRALPRVQQGTCQVTIDTQCQLWNRRFYTVMVHYHLLFLRKEPPRLHFRRFLTDGTQRL